MRSIAGLPFLLQEKMEVVLVPPQIDAPRSGSIEAIRVLKEDSYLVTLDTVSDIDTAESLVGCYFLVDRKKLPAHFEDIDESPFIGYSVRDNRFGTLGHVEELIEGSLQARLSVKGPHGDLLIPFVDEFIISVDNENETIQTAIPSGLLELASGERLPDED